MGDLPGNVWAKRCGVCCGTFVVIMSIIIFAVCMANYVHLGPNEQVLLKESTGKYVKNGPWSGQLNPFHGKTRRNAQLLDALQYAIVQDILTSVQRVEAGPQLFFPGAYDEIQSINTKIVLEKHQFVRLTDQMTGEETVSKGPGTVVPTVYQTHNGIEDAVFVNKGTSLVLVNKLTGLQELVTICNYPSGVWAPEPLQELVDIRELIHVLPHEAMVVRDVDGLMTVYSGRSSTTNADGCSVSSTSDGNGVGFFLPPYSKILRMQWSTYSNPSSTRRMDAITGMGTRQTEDDFGDFGGGGHHFIHRPSNSNNRRLSREAVHVYDEGLGQRRLDSIYVDQISTSISSAEKRNVTAIDLRTQKSFYEYEVRTRDNVRLLLSGTIFWQISDVASLMNMTSDPESDVWSRCRSILIGAVSTVTLDTFMSTFNDIVVTAFDASKSSSFWSDRGLVMISMELNDYSPVDETTATTLQSIIRQSVQRINDLQKQASDSDVEREKLEADILLERNMTVYYQQQAYNKRIEAETAGSTEGGRHAEIVGTFLESLASSVDNATERLELFKQEKRYNSTQLDTQQLTNGNASLFMSPKDMELRLQMQ
mmetsp:Transcript_43294/g.92667  ORF Transcript_43294/g.92667 Transcript_43294/m.92667 type:complete len:595 (-) Transcript_43294:24-1808(-)